VDQGHHLESLNNDTMEPTEQAIIQTCHAAKLQVGLDSIPALFLATGSVPVLPSHLLFDTSPGKKGLQIIAPPTQLFSPPLPILKFFIWICLKKSQETCLAGFTGTGSTLNDHRACIIPVVKTDKVPLLRLMVKKGER